MSRLRDTIAPVVMWFPQLALAMSILLMAAVVMDLTLQSV